MVTSTPEPAASAAALVVPATGVVSDIKMQCPCRCVLRLSKDHDGSLGIGSSCIVGQLWV